MKKIIFSIIAAGCMLLAFTNSAAAQKKITIKLESKAVDASRGVSNPHIKSEVPVTDKVEAKPRGLCSIYFDNYCGLYVKVYVDGYYRGTISPYGAMTMNVEGGYTEIYIISIGGTGDWEATGNCRGSYTYSLY
ncbi:MAG: hypothetical protein ABIR30_02700 [Chitinophagaceae bacterium]